MDDSFFYFKLADDHFICLSPLSKDILGDLGADSLGDEFGYFLYESSDRSSHSCTKILAKCESYEAASRLIELYKTSPVISRAA